MHCGAPPDASRPQFTSARTMKSKVVILFAALGTRLWCRTDHLQPPFGGGIQRVAAGWILSCGSSRERTALWYGRDRQRHRTRERAPRGPGAAVTAGAGSRRAPAGGADLHRRRAYQRRAAADTIALIQVPSGATPPGAMAPTAAAVPATATERPRLSDGRRRPPDQCLKPVSVLAGRQS
ncbi:hypothetical protein EVAR_64138_1 [Eumeta japonica]|uniref:Uncharacterized protein n=1 Tax=Eumeta variegata TaxID=151549 RepID=A0A4C2A6C2_EUMVA|nr:hypothetical protein EVAR_64138_1 [Eumeta japonica]